MNDFFARRAARLGTFLRSLAAAFFGHVSWQPPGWLRSLRNLLRAHPTRSVLLPLAVVLAVLGGRYAYTHRKIPVPPRLVTATIIAPAIPALADKITPPDLCIRFDASAAALLLVDKTLDPHLVRLEPARPGAWHWSGDRQLVFTPTQEWPAEQTLRVTIDPAALGPRVKLAAYQLETRTPDFSARLAKYEFYQNPQNPAVKEVTGTLVFTHAVALAEVERRLSVAMLGQSPVFGSPSPAKLFSLLPGRHQREFFLRTVPLSLPKEGDTMKLRLAAGLSPVQGDARLPRDLTDTVGVPDLYSFFWIKETTTRIVKNKSGQPEQFLIVETSCAARSEDLAKTLEVYALPFTNPARHLDATAAETPDAEDDHDDSDEDDDHENYRSRSRRHTPPGNHDGRFHDDDDHHTDEGTEPAEKVDAPQRFDDWAPDEVDDAALALARPVPVTLVPSHDEQTTLHAFRLRRDTPGYLFAQIGKGVPAPGGYLLREDYEAVVSVPVPDKEIILQGDGGVLALSGERKLSVESRGVPAIRYEIARVPAAEINHLASQTEGSFQQPEFINRHFNEQDLARITVETQAINAPNPIQTNYSTFDFTAHLHPVVADGLDREGLFFLTASGWDPKTNKYLRNVEASRFVLVTDLGLLVKRNADGSRDVFVASLATGAPLAGTEISVLARSGATLATAPTDPEGRASLPGLGKNPRDSREPVAIVARRGGDVAFLPYERGDRTLDYSRFPIEGVENRTGHELDAFVFTERGIYRPGDTLHVGVVVKQRDWNGSLDGLPLETEVVDARDQPFNVSVLTLPASGFAEWSYDTAHDSPTGGYALNVYLRRDGKRSTLLGSTTVQVKEFLPDRLKLDATLSKTSGPSGHGWVTPDDLRGSVVLKNLYGTAASDRRIKAHLRLNPHGFSFKEYPGYTFYDRLREPKKEWEGDTVELGDQQTNADGAANFEFDLKRFADVTCRLTFDAEGFEAEGGRSVEDLTGTLVSPLPSVVGWHADGDLNWITAGGPGRTVEFVAVDRALKRIPLENLTLHLAERQYISVLTKGDDGNYRYESIRRERPIRDEPFVDEVGTAVPAVPLVSAEPSLPFLLSVASVPSSTPSNPLPSSSQSSVILSAASPRAQPKDLPPWSPLATPSQSSVILSAASPRAQPKDLPPPEAPWVSPTIAALLTSSHPSPLPTPPSPSAFILHPSSFILPSASPGNYVLELRDAAGLAVSRLEYTVVGQGQVTRSLEKNAELEIHLSRDQYRAGEEIEIAVTAPYAGSGLITIERERVYTHRWFKSTGTSSVQKITIPPDFDGSGYVNVSFVRALDSREIFMSPLSYAVAPFTANLERRRLHVELHAAEKSKPGEPLAIRYRTDRPAKIAVFAVDQGILQVTRFPLPDPLAHQFRKNALTVRTSQFMDLLLPEFLLLRAAQSTGGDGDPGVLNPFRRVTEKPVVYWSGILDADATERTVTYPVPDYFSGTLTLMAVAVAPDALGSVKASTLCRNAFVLTPGVPTLAAPGDEFEVGLTVANGQIGSGPDARITVQPDPGPGLQILRAPTEPLRIPEGREASTTFRVRALDRLGSTQLGFRASANGEDSHVHATLSIRPAAPFRTVVTSGNFRGSVHDTPVARSLYPEYRRLEASVSALPLGLARGLERYLKEYPHGCSEQITSAAFARLSLADEADFGLTRAEAAAQIEHTITVERRRQNDGGGFGFWDASKTPDIDFVTAYVMHFLSEAKAAGYPVPDDMFNKGLNALQRMTSASPWSLQQARVQAYALYVLTREGVVTTNHLLTLTDYLDTYYKPRWHADLTGVYLAGCWSLLKKDDEARRLIDGYHLGRHDPGEWWDFYQPLCADAQYLTILARHFPDRLRRVTPGEFENVTRPIGNGEFSTLSAAYAVQALKAYSQVVAHDPPHLSVAALVTPKGQETPLPFEGRNATLLRGPFPPSATALRFHADGGTGGPLGIYYQAVQSGFDRTPPAQATSFGLEISRELLGPDGKTPVTKVKLGDRVTVRLRFRATRPLPVTNVAILDLLPGGFEIADDSLRPGVGVAGMDYVDVREDRAIFYGTATNQLHEITYRLKPTARGEFVVPPIFAESMYDKRLQSLGLGGHLTVTDAK